MYETHGLDTQEQCFFYEQDFYVLSNFSAFKILYRGYVFDTAEHAYHFNKFVYFSTNEEVTKTKKAILDRILTGLTSAHEAFTYARVNKDYVNPHWNDHKEQCMLEILHAKCEQHEYVARKLEATGDRELVENSWRDDYWGWGPNRDGQNRLGKLWMQVREQRRAAKLWNADKAATAYNPNATSE